MKIRSGFVSNSSSSSFIIEWRDRHWEEGKTLIESLVCLFDDAYDYDFDKKEFKSKLIGDKIPKLVLELSENKNTWHCHAEDLGKGRYRHTFSTTMLNYPTDYPQECKELLMALNYDAIIDRNFEIINLNVEG